jgi:hypothetical protein
MLNLRRRWRQSFHFQVILDDAPARRDHEKLGIGKLRERRLRLVHSLTVPLDVQAPICQLALDRYQRRNVRFGDWFGDRLHSFEIIPY